MNRANSRNVLQLPEVIRQFRILLKFGEIQIFLKFLIIFGNILNRHVCDEIYSCKELFVQKRLD